MSARRVLASYSRVAILLAVSFAVVEAGGQTGGTPPPSKTTPTPSSVPTAPRPPEDRHPVFLSGRVLLDDGTPPNERVAIERVCNGRVRREAYTDSHGQFSFQLGAERQMMQDASIGSSTALGPLPGFSDESPTSGPRDQSSGISMRELMGCELQASLPGFRSNSISLTGRQMFSKPDVGTIVLHRIGKVEGTRISVTTAAAPKEAKKAFERGTNLLKQNKPAEAASEFTKAITSYPKFAEALARLGEIYSEQGRGEEATKLLQQAIAADSKFLAPYLDLARLAGRKQDWKQMAEWSQKALALNAYEYPGAYFLDAIANYNLRNLETAEKSARMARRLDSQYRTPRIDVLLANILLQREDYSGAAEQLKSFLKYSPTGQEADAARDLLQRAESKLAEARK